MARPGTATYISSAHIDDHITQILLAKLHYFHSSYTSHLFTSKSSASGIDLYGDSPRYSHGGTPHGYAHAHTAMILPLQLSNCKSARNTILQRDWENTIQLAKSYMSLKHIVSSDDIASGWCRVWDSALGLGYRGTKLSQCLFRSLFSGIASATTVIPTV